MLGFCHIFNKLGEYYFKKEKVGEKVNLEYMYCSCVSTPNHYMKQEDTAPKLYQNISSTHAACSETGHVCDNKQVGWHNPT